MRLSLCCFFVVPEGAVSDLHHRPPLLGMLPALLDLAIARSVQPRNASVPQNQTQHQLPDYVPDVFQQLHQPFSVHAVDQELQGVHEEVQSLLVSRQLL